MSVKNKAYLITYADSLGGSLAELNDLLQHHFRDIFQGGVHLLPPFPSSADRGFAPKTYFEIDPAFGNWEDIRRIGERFDIILDLMVNHISRQSVYFQDFAQKGRQSEYADLFITLDRVWPEGSPPAADLAKIFLRRPDHPFADIPIVSTGAVERVWATFGTSDWSEQIDLDVHSPKTRELFTQILSFLSANQVKMLRLDAVGYVIKKPGTSCFFVEPEIYEFMDWMQREAHAVGMELLPEVHSDSTIPSRLAQHDYWVYDFVLPLLVLHTLLNRTSAKLRQYLRVCPRKQFTQLDCHDGIPVQPDLDGILEVDEAQSVVKTCLERGANLSLILSEEHKRRPDFAAHQINCTYFSALGGNEDAYLTARAIQFFSPGVPLVYYVGMLAGENDQEEVNRTGERRAINRHNYTVAEVEQALQKPVVQRLMDLIRFRNEYDAFNGNLEVGETSDHELQLTWQNGRSWCRLTVDLDTSQSLITYRDEVGEMREFRL